MVHLVNVYKLKTHTFKQQLDGGVIPWAQLDDSSISCAINQLPLATRLTQLGTFIQNTDAYIHYGDNTDLQDLYPACYIGATDTIGMPYPVQFFATEDYRGILNYYSILLHEIGHWTAHPQRMNRKGTHAFGTKAYALEELTAELTSAFVLNQLQITESPVLDKADYITKWHAIIAMFGNDTSSLTTAELQASKACAYLFSLQNELS